ncbi:hypothetical protein, partial [Rhizobium sp. R693]|uniref:hypothetical protein n=1 Tax=Rhizobium sp. R693 TaxID=1764276 RepID=UPI0016738E5E
ARLVLLQDANDLFVCETVALHSLVLSMGQSLLQNGLFQRGKVIDYLAIVAYWLKGDEMAEPSLEGAYSATTKQWWVSESCRLASNDIFDCHVVKGIQWEIDHNWTAIRVGIVVLVVGWLLYRKRAALEDAFVNGVARLIRGKRRVGNRIDDVKNRIVEKANE